MVARSEERNQQITLLRICDRLQYNLKLSKFTSIA